MKHNVQCDTCDKFANMYLQISSFTVFTYYIYYHKSMINAAYVLQKLSSVANENINTI